MWVLARMDKKRRHALLSWVFVGVMLALCAALGALQYRWLGEVSRAEQERLRAGLQASLRRLSQDFNAELTSACAALLPESPPGGESPERAYEASFLRWQASGRHTSLFRRIAVAIPENGSIRLFHLDFSRGRLAPGEWPPGWERMKERMEARAAGEPFLGRRSPVFLADFDPALIEIPRWRRPEEPREPPFRMRPTELEWLILETDLEYVRNVMLPELLQRHLGSSSLPLYQVEVVSRQDPTKVIFHSGSGAGPHIGANADASVHLFEVQWDQIFRRLAPPVRPEELERRGLRRPEGERWKGPPRDLSGLDRGRWLLLVRHRAGSIDALVARSRHRNLAVTGIILVLMVVAAAALVRYTRRAQQLAELQMEFVAGVSHELKTPLSVISSAAYNLQGGVVNDPQKVKRYGALIREEVERLTEMVDQVLRFAGLRANATPASVEPVAAPELVEEALDATRKVIEEARCTVETTLEAGLPPVLGDSIALRHVLQNLLSNAAKYGGDGRWIGVSATSKETKENRIVEIRVKDRGPGIPPEDLEHIFDPFYRGRNALQDQIHGTGLGLSLAKRIVESHHGKITVVSELGKGTEFIVQLPAGEWSQGNEFANSAD